MTIVFWIIAGFAALGFLAVGLMKLVRSKAALASSGMGWVQDFPPTSIKLIGLAEVLGAVGLIVPVLTGIAPILSPLAGICLAIAMAGAVRVHTRRNEPRTAPILFGSLALLSSVLGILVVLK